MVNCITVGKRVRPTLKLYRVEYTKEEEMVKHLSREHCSIHGLARLVSTASREDSDAKYSTLVHNRSVHQTLCHDIQRHTKRLRSSLPRDVDLRLPPARSSLPAMSLPSFPVPRRCSLPFWRNGLAEIIKMCFRVLIGTPLGTVNHFKGSLVCKQT